MDRIRSLAQRIRSSISRQSAGLYANMADGAVRHPYVKYAAAVVAVIVYTCLVVAISVALCNPTPGPNPTRPDLTPGPNPEIPCGTRVPVGPRVINGDQAIPHDFPWMAFLEGHRYWKTNAALIHKYFVVTVNAVRPGDVVVLAAHNRSDTSEVTRQEFVIETVFIHPNWSANLPWGGMRLAKLSRPVNFNMYINRVCRPKQHFIPAAGSSCKIVGWGRTNYTGSPNDLLHEGSLRIISNDQCKRDIHPYYREYITNATFCTAANETHPDWDDKGSPLLCEHEKGVFGVYGVLVHPGHSTRPSLFYNVTMMESWMDELFSQYNAE